MSDAQRRPVAAHLPGVPTASKLPTAVSRPLRTAWGSPKGWSGQGRYGVLLSSAADGEVTDRTYDPRADVWSAVDSLDAAHTLGSTVRRAQPGLQFEVMRLEHGTWRDFMGRTVAEVIRQRWT